MTTTNKDSDTLFISKISPTVHIANVVSTFSLGVENVPLQKIAQFFQFAEYQPKKFAALTIRLTTKIKKTSSKTTALVFSSGNVVVTGSKNILTSLYSSRKYARLLQKIGYDVCFFKFKVQNIVASADCGFPIKLAEISSSMGLKTSWEPESFPGLVYRTSKIVFIIFRSGKIVITGGKTLKHVYSNFNDLYQNVLIHYADKHDLTTSSSRYKKSCKNNEMELDDFINQGKSR